MVFTDSVLPDNRGDATFNQTRLDRRAAHVKRDEVTNTDGFAEFYGTNDAGCWSGFHHVHRLALGIIGCHDPAAGVHDVELTFATFRV